jgi:hypothetical protein
MSVALQRRVQAYPPEKYLGMVRAYAALNRLSESEAVTRLIKSSIDSLPAAQRIELEKTSKKISGSKNSY